MRGTKVLHAMADKMTNKFFIINACTSNVTEEFTKKNFRNWLNFGIELVEFPGDSYELLICVFELTPVQVTILGECGR